MNIVGLRQVLLRAWLYCLFTGTYCAWCWLKTCPLNFVVLLLVHGASLRLLNIAWCWLVEWERERKEFLISFTLTIDHRVSQPACVHIQLSFTLIWTIQGVETNYSQSRTASSPCLDDSERGVFKEQQKPALSFKSTNCSPFISAVLCLHLCQLLLAAKARIVTSSSVSSSLPTLASALQLEGALQLEESTAYPSSQLYCVFISANCC